MGVSRGFEAWIAGGHGRGTAESVVKSDDKECRLAERG
jgi:hypothetical protein